MQGFTEQGGKQVRGNVWPNFRVWLHHLRRAVSRSTVSFKALPSGTAMSAPLGCIAMSIKTLTGASSIPADVDEQSRAAKHDIGRGESALGGVESPASSC